MYVRTGEYFQLRNALQLEGLIVAVPATSDYECRCDRYVSSYSKLEWAYSVLEAWVTIPTAITTSDVLTISEISFFFNLLGFVKESLLYGFHYYTHSYLKTTDYDSVVTSWVHRVEPESSRLDFIEPEVETIVRLVRTFPLLKGCL